MLLKILLSFLVLTYPSICSNASQVLSYAALGDSYATGAGSGSPVLWPPGEVGCGQFYNSYPRQVANDTLVKGSPIRYLACGGATTHSVLRGQVSKIGDSRFVTVTVGGNEVDFFKVVNACVYQWWPVGTCNRAVQKSRVAIESSNLLADFDKMVKGITKVLQPDARLLVTGYASFFNEKTDQCNHVSFSRTNRASRLTVAKRKALNDLVRLLNDVIKSTALANGAEYVDIDNAFQGHRFCEAHVMEPDPGREDTWFLTLGSKLQMFTGAEGRQENEHELEDEQIVLSGARAGVPEFSVFHPTRRGQTAIAREVLNKLATKRRK